MKGGTAMTNPKLSTLLLVFRHERRLRLTELRLTTATAKVWAGSAQHSETPQAPGSHELFQDPFQRHNLLRAGGMPGTPSSIWLEFQA